MKRIGCVSLTTRAFDFKSSLSLSLSLLVPTIPNNKGASEEKKKEKKKKKKKTLLFRTTT